MNRRALFLLAAIAAPAAAAPVKVATYKDFYGVERPIAGMVVFNADGTLASISGGAAGPAAAVTDSGNASFNFAPAGGAAESSTAASYTFSTASQAAVRGWYANCPANTAVVVTLTTVAGGSAPRTLYDGWQDSPDRLAGFAGNSAGCTIGERF